MLKALRFALVALATLSSVMFASPASAGMISTPKPASDCEQREAAKELLKCRLTESGALPPGFDESVDRMSTQDLVVLAGHVETSRNAGSVLLAVGIAAAVAVVVTLLLFETFYPER
ncbi:MAG: hypothetical protein FD180_4248 [Planctomycetota bacterium]|nr:MAG: hypothetical protein FD180_4248 [Planctomycetota bacterium]